MPLRSPNSDVYTRSGPHKKLERFLEEFGFKYESEYYFSPYTVDIYLPDWHIGIEVDGPYHSKEKDAKRDNHLLKNYGLHILRVKTKNNVTKIKFESMILGFIDQHYEDSEQRKKTWLSLLH